MNTISHGGTSAAMFNNTRVDLARPQPVRYTSVERGACFEKLSQFKQAVADWAVGAGFNVLTKKSDK
jgi:hypothetical protein